MGNCYRKRLFNNDESYEKAIISASNSPKKKVQNPLIYSSKLPSPMIKYLLQNMTPRAYEKLIQTNKYFFHHFKRLILKEAIIGGAPLDNIFGWNLNSKTNFLVNGKLKIDLNKLDLWLFEGLSIVSSTQDEIDGIFNHVYNMDCRNLRLNKIEINKITFIKLTKNVKQFWMDNTKIKNESGGLMTLGDILEVIPQIKSIKYTINPYTFQEQISFVTTASSDIPTLPKITHLCLEAITTNLDYASFFQFVKNHPKTKFSLVFHIRYYLTACAGQIIEEFPDAQVRYDVNEDLEAWYITYEGVDIYLVYLVPGFR